MLLPALAVCLLLSTPLPAAAQPGPNLLRNATFDANVEGWSRWFSPGQCEGEAKWVARDAGGALDVIVLRRDTASAIQIYQGPFAVRQGRWYAVSFEVRAAEPMALRVALMGNNPPYAGLGLSADLHLETGWETVSLLAIATGDSDDARIDFFPERSMQLDNVAVRELPSLPERLAVAEVQPGPGWQAGAGNLIDGDPSSALNSGYYPDVPLLLALDLGRAQPVGAVIVRGREYGNYNVVQQLEVELSADGADWFAWGRAAKAQEGSSTGSRQTTWTATNVAALARFVRLRISSVRGGANLTEAEVLAAPAASEAALARLPRVPPEADVCFLGWDYDRLGYDLTPGEPFALRFANRGARDLDLPLTWRLETFAGDELAHGETPLHLAGASLADAPLPLPQAMGDGPHRVRFHVGGGAEDAFYFDYRAAGQRRRLRLAAVMDCLDPEGWARLVLGAAAGVADVRKTLPDDPSQVDAALVMAENWPPDAPEVVALKRYLGAGGKAIFYAKLPPALQDLAPVTLNADSPWIEEPQLLQQPGFWRGAYAAEDAVPQYAVRVEARPEAKILARWSGGSPAVVEGAYGAGRVVYIGTPPGRRWRRGSTRGEDELTLQTLAYLLDSGEASPALVSRGSGAERQREQREAATLRRCVPKPPPDAAEGVSEGSFGRFGWLVRESGLAHTLSDSAEIRSPAGGAPWSLTVPGRGPLSGRVSELNWLSKRIEWRDERGPILTSTVSVAAPCLLWEGDAREVSLTGQTTHVAVPTADGPRVLASGDELRGDALTAGWAVLLNAAPDALDVPRLVVFSRRPSTLHVGEELTASFPPAGFGALWTGYLHGLRRFAPGETAGWAESVPPSVTEQAERLARLCLAFPTACDEVYWAEGDSVTIVNRFTHRTFTDDWGTQPLPLAPLPPVLSLLVEHGYPAQVEGELLDTGLATVCGPLRGVAGDRVQYRLPLPPREHFGVIPVPGRMDLAREIDSTGVQGVATVQQSSGGLTTGSPFVADLRAYMDVGQVPPFEAQHLDLYKWWYCFPTVAGRPAFGPEARETIDAHHREHYWRTLNFYAPKGLIRHRREPWTGLDYAVSFIWPVLVDDGVRYFVDQNESAAVVLYCLDMYSRYYGDWTTCASNWNLALYTHRYLTRVHDWAFMTSSNQEYFNTVGIDMLNSEYPGNLAYSRMAQQVGDVRAEREGLYLAAKALVPALARFYMPDYVQSITPEGDPWRKGRFYWSLRDTGLDGQESMVQRGDTGFILGLACGMLDTSKGTGPEIALAYKHFIPERIDAYEHDVQTAEREDSSAAGWAHCMTRAMLGWPRDDVIGTARRFCETHPNFGWQLTKGPHNLAITCVADTPVLLADWAPAEYVSGSFDPTARALKLAFRQREADPTTIRVFSPWEPTAMRVNGQPETAWTYDANEGSISFRIGEGQTTVELTLAPDERGPRHPYFPR